jgi:hypothetical protein
LIRLRLEKLPSRFPGGRLPVLVLILLLAAYLALHFYLEGCCNLCWFKAVTGFSCPTCGLGRSFHTLLTGHPLSALSYNPFMLIFTFAVLGNRFLILAFKRGFTLSASTVERRYLLIAFLSLLAANWLYVISRLG